MYPFFIMLFLIACGAENNDNDLSDQCPTPQEDACMTEDLYQDCLDIASDCPDSLLFLESCPYGGFSCE